MPIPNEKRRLAVRRFSNQFYRNETAELNLDDILAALDTVYDFFDLDADELSIGQTVQANILARLPQPFKEIASAEMKGYLAAEVMLIRGGFV